MLEVEIGIKNDSNAITAIYVPTAGDLHLMDILVYLWKFPIEDTMKGHRVGTWHIFLFLSNADFSFIESCVEQPQLWIELNKTCKS